MPAHVCARVPSTARRSCASLRASSSPGQARLPNRLASSADRARDPRRTLYDAKPKFESFLQSVLSGKAAPAKFTPKPREPELFIPSTGDDNALVTRKRAAAAPQGRPKRQRR